MNKARVNLVLDAMIGIAFLVEAVSGFVLAIVLPHGGFQGGRNALHNAQFLITRDQWLLWHDGFAIVMVVGVLAHVIVHWRWIACMVRNLWREAWAPKPAAAHALDECPANQIPAIAHEEPNQRGAELSNPAPLASLSPLVRRDGIR